MKNPFALLLRYIALRRNGSEVPHGLHPLSAIRQATVLLSPLEEDCSDVKADIERFFGQKNITVRLICPDKKDLDLIGTVKKKFRADRLPEGSGELLVSLPNPDGGFWTEYEARCSNACFKIGRRQCKGGVFDLVILSPDSGNPSSQSAVFSEIKTYLNNVIR